MEMRAAIAEFLRYCAVERRLSENSIQAYAYDLADFNAWLAAAIETEITTGTLKAYLQVIVSERKLAAATVRRRIACLRAFFRRVGESTGHPDPFTGWRLTLPKRKRLPRALSRGEVAALLARTHPTRADKQMAMAVRLMVATGLRVGEVCRLRVEDISPDGASLRVQGKGSRDRVAYIADLAFRAELQAIAAQRRSSHGPAGPLFVNRSGAGLKPQSVRTKLRHVATAAGLARRVTPHMLRHTAATLLIETGVDIRIVQKLLGHSSIATTEIYTHVSDQTLRSTLERANVLQGLGAS
jgi:integrase/recombinase XerD